MIRGRFRLILQALDAADGPIFSADIVEGCEGVRHGNVHSYLGTMASRGWAQPLPKQGTHFRRYQITPLGKVALLFSDAEHEYFRGGPR